MVQQADDAAAARMCTLQTIHGALGVALEQHMQEVARERREVGESFSRGHGAMVARGATIRGAQRGPNAINNGLVTPAIAALTVSVDEVGRRMFQQNFV